MVMAMPNRFGFTEVVGLHSAFFGNLGYFGLNGLV
jgi:hypothetical protein